MPRSAPARRQFPPAPSISIVCAWIRPTRLKRALTAIKGIGPWTADVFLLFCLGHADAWPAGDLALQEAVRLALDRPTRPDARTMIAIGARWQPLRAVAARVLWAFYGHIKRRNVAPDGVVAVNGDAP